MPQLLGPKIPFYAPLRPSKKASIDSGSSLLDRSFARILCKDSVGLFLGLVPAPYRYSRFDSKPAGAESTNDGRRFMINDKVGAKPFKLRIKAGNQIPVDGQSQGSEPEPGPTTRTVKSLSLYVPQHITVFDLIWWINNDSPSWLRLNGTAVDPLDGYQTGRGVLQVLSVTTPAERKYNVRTDLIPIARPIITTAYTDIDPTPITPPVVPIP